MLWTNQAMGRPGWIEIAGGVGIPFDPHAVPYIRWNHIDGPVLHMRNSQLHWLTFWEQFLYAINYADEYTLERKHIPEFVARWEERLRSVSNPFMGKR
jgi:hypothetical protein